MVKNNIALFFVLAFCITVKAQYRMIIHSGEDSLYMAACQIDSVTFDEVEATNISVSGKFGLQPYKGKKILSIGDSFTYQNGYGPYLAKATGCSQRGRGLNGNLLRSFCNDYYSVPGGTGESYEVFDSAMLSEYDIVTIMGGTNDFGHGGTVLGSLEEAEEDGALGNECNTIYGACWYLVNKLYSLKPDIKIYFCTQPYRVDFAGEPGGYGENRNGLSMEKIADAIVDFCGHYGIPCYDFYHCSGWNQWTVRRDAEGRVVENIYTSDGLHPKFGDGNGADLLGTSFGLFINSH